LPKVVPLPPVAVAKDRRMSWWPVTRRGAMRRTLLIGPWAFKFPKGARGRRSNLLEAQYYQSASAEAQTILCPVLMCAPAGWFLVMLRATQLSQEECHQLMDCDGFPNWPDYVPNSHVGAPFEYKAENWGWLKGRLVVFDYHGPNAISGN
jgi:uncharacterized protein YbdZ (MbtH family)